ncbi:hypothetical protein M408DRAFT_325423 [Serendipita vermifera MAFF 305830]|uniref:Uncharacterized protein n=1 Tax=Serendipita vermifera MAFF 305830 TaxID=933852 RepID=A0A0C3BP16_SERVB|nr:hypothetical protein M408DRAFT_325423 [Serendipita vermifera MAFF 305830]
MRFILAALACFLPLLVVASPLPEAAVVPRALGRTGSYTISGLGARKKQLIACGANSLDLAIAMLETDTMNTRYTYGDGKTYDAANFGVFKQNWGMLRQSVSRYRGKSANDWNTGAELNSNLCLDIQLRHESQNHFGEGTWFAGHRNGASGLSNPNTQDIQNYKDAIYWIRNQIQYNNNGAGMTNDVRWWVDVPAI